MVEDLCPQVGEALTPEKKELLVRFVRRLALVMTAQLRAVVQQSVEAFVQVWEQFAAPEQAAAPDAHAPASPRGEQQTAQTAQARARAACEPIFEVQLTVEGDRFEFVPKMSELEGTVSGVVITHRRQLLQMLPQGRVGTSHVRKLCSFRHYISLGSGGPKQRK